MSIEERIVSLERSNRRQRLVIAGLTLATVGGFTLAMASSQAARDLTVGTLTARRVVVIDENGGSRIESFQSTDGSFGLRINDAEGRKRVRIFNNPGSDTGAIQCLYGNGTKGAELAAGDVSTGLNCFKSDGELVLNATWSPAFEASTLQLGNAKSLNTVSLSSTAGGNSSLTIKDEVGVTRLSLQANEAGSAGVILKDKDDQPRASIQVTSEGNSGIIQWDSNGRQRFNRSILANGDASDRMLDAEQRI